MAGSPSYALADLALALTRAAPGVEAVLETAVRAAAGMIGDGAAVHLVRADGLYGQIACYHPGADASARLADVLTRAGSPPDDPYSEAMRVTRRPVVLSPLTRERFQDLVSARHWPDFERDGPAAAVLCPLMVDNTYLGFLALVRTSPGGTYPSGDVDLARDIAGEVALALASVRSLERLEASEERYRRVLETIPEGVLQLDGDGLTTFANEPIATVLGFPRDHLVGLPMRGFLDNRGQVELPRWLAECREGHAAVGEARLVRADGSTRYVRLSMVPLPAGEGSLCMVTDITDQVEVRGLKRQLDHLRRLDSLGQLIGGIAHDFNNLLTVVAGSADIIAAGSEPDSTPHQLATGIVHATVKGRTLARQLLAFGRGGGSRPEIIAVPDLLTDIQPLFGRTLGEHIDLTFTVAPDVWPIRAERGPLEQTLVNIAANSRDAMPRGGAVKVTAANVTVTAGQLDDPALSGRFVRLLIADTGNGMDDRTRRQACEPFFTTRSAAAGLGLSTAASIVRAAGGHLCLESAPRIGTTVQIYLPAVDRAVEPTAAPAGDGTGTAGGHFLVVEDQPELAQLIRRLLEPAGYAVTVATEARDAIMKVVGGMNPDLLITDVVMPGMTGPELAVSLREHHPDLPVLYMSGYTAAALGPQVRLDASSVMVEKPFNRETLLTAVRRLRST